MLNLAAFASLAQLGSGLALTLAIFIEPIKVREQRFRRALESASMVLIRDGSEAALDRENDIMAKMVALDTAADIAHSLASWPMHLVRFGAGLNFLILLLATICPDSEVSTNWTWIILALSILPVAIGVLWLILIARAKIN